MADRTPSFAATLDRHGFNLRRAALQTLQINLGRRCNQACRHCHVEAAPWRTEMMDREVFQRIAEWMGRQPDPVSVGHRSGRPRWPTHHHGQPLLRLYRRQREQLHRRPRLN